MNRKVLITYIKDQISSYTNSHNKSFYDSGNDSVLDYGDNEFFLGKKEAFEDILDFIEKN